ncbi:hypothetical protein FGY93_07145 [Paenibacillus polymyxa]|nr:hypothetical protein FGY93_07145 [Paenibacillus polymyxa]
MKLIKENNEQMEQPKGNGKFQLYNERKGNEVKPIKDTFFFELLKYI